MDEEEGPLARLYRWVSRPPAGAGLGEHVRTAARIAWGIVDDLAEGSITRHAASLSYTTLLSLVPMLALSFAVLKGLGAENTLMPLLAELLRPLGENADPIQEALWGFVSKVEASVLGAFGLALLAYTAVSVMQKIEGAFNELWQVRHGRSLGRKFADYLSLLMVGPLLLVSAVGLVRTLQDRAAGDELADYGWLQQLLLDALALAPFGLLLLAFAALYAILPNTRVRALPAFGAALFAGLLWLAAARIFAGFVAAAGSYTAIYSAFAALVLFLIWLNVNWTIVLIGADVAYYLQHPDRLKERAAAPLPPAAAERLGLRLIAEIVRRQYQGLPPPTAAELARRLGGSESDLAAMLAQLVAGGLIARSEHHPPRYLLLPPPETTTCASVLAVIRGDSGAPQLPAEPADAVALAAGQAIASGTQAWTLKALADATTSRRDASRWIDEALG